jgi:membrane protease YdiL (CAAX protease family)
MSENLLNKKRQIKWNLVLLLPLWVALGFGVSQLVLTGVVLLLNALGVPFALLNSTVLNTVFAACVYSLTVLIVVGAPYWLKKLPTTKQEIGLWRLPTWADIGLAPAGFIVYLLITALLAYGASLLIPGYDAHQVQQTGFTNLTAHYEYVLAFVTLIVLTPVAEEILFRGYLYGKLRKIAPVWLSILVTSVLFGAVHGQWNVGIDVFALSLILCSLREVTGSIWAGILLHMLKNSIAFYLLFINPTLLNIMGG